MDDQKRKAPKGMSRRTGTPKPKSEKKPDEGIKFGTRGKPTKAQLALLERYKAETGRSVVNNTIEGIVGEKIHEIHEVIGNMIAYGDPNIFKLLPKDLDNMMRTYGVFAQEHFGKTLTSLKNTQVFVIPEHFRLCNKCGNYKDSSDFYICNSDASDGYTSLCKECANTLFTDYFNKYEDISEALILISSKLDIMVYEPVLKRYIKRFDTPNGKESFGSRLFLGEYIGETNSIYKSLDIPVDRRNFYNTNLGGIPFKCIPYKSSNPNVYDDRFMDDGESDTVKYSNAKISKLKAFWGDFENKDLIVLDTSFQNYKEQYNIDDLVRENMVKQICYEELDILIARMNGQKTSDKIRSYRDLLKDSDLTPRDNEKLQGAEYYSSLGSLIAHCEERGPIISTNSAFKDVDGIERIWTSMVGAIQRTAGQQTEYVDMFEEQYKEFSVDIAEEVGDPNE